jgi:hypothetical protein
MQILMTGTTSPQASSALNARSLSFTGAVANALTANGHTVSLMEPEIAWTTKDLAAYDSVIVGVAPFTSVAANHAYASLRALNTLWGDPRLRLLVDAPRPMQIGASLRSLAATPDNLTKAFYARRKNYRLACEPETLAELRHAVTRLLDEQWPTTLYPSLPWHSPGEVRDQVQENAQNSLVGIAIDAFLVSDVPPMIRPRQQRWLSDELKATWTQRLLPTLGHDVEPTRKSTNQTDEDVSKRLAESTGTLVAPTREGTWWSPRHIQSLNNGTPIATDWRTAGRIGSAWEVLPSAVEDLTDEGKIDLAWSQLESYMKHTQTPDEVSAVLTEAVSPRKTKRKENK